MHFIFLLLILYHIWKFQCGLHFKSIFRLLFLLSLGIEIPLTNIVFLIKIILHRGNLSIDQQLKAMFEFQKMFNEN